MTAEVAVMNKDAVALAADSAVTVSGEKTYHTINKLFCLSKLHPIGVMVYGSAELGGIPWETIIKLYRKHLGNNLKNTVEEYFIDFIKFIETDIKYFDPSEQDMFFLEYVEKFLHFIRDAIDSEIEKMIEDKPVDDSIVLALLHNTIDNQYEKWSKEKKLDFASEALILSVSDKYSGEVKKAVDDILEKHEISTEYLNKITQICSNMFCSKVVEDSGLVFAGFGEEDIFPMLVSCKVECLLNEKLKYIKEDNPIITNKPDEGAAIMAFAEEDVVDSFMQGINPKLYEHMVTSIAHMLKGHNEYILDQLSEIITNEETKNEFTDKINKNMGALIEKFAIHLRGYMQENHINPAIDAIQFLPKIEMAEVAESLVSITSFKQKISLDKETVGGAIDVAIISKCDGFIWIKRKHYVTSELNPVFL
ncbi:MAG: hypothetical protein GY862_29095 [Gammaproteobacteria bacterium]|nr:hypothetical protein [Gammaproteobacteria bacterium]